MQKQRIYVDTSVFGGYYDDEFSKFTIPFFERLKKGAFRILFSDLTQEELEHAPQHVIDLVKELEIENTEFLEPTEEVVELAGTYIAENVVGQASYADCLHIALASVNRADYLVSWNFKHIVNVQRIRGYNAVNLKYGYRLLEIRSPRDFTINEDND